MNVSWRVLFASVALVTAMASDTYASPDFGATCTSCHNQRTDGALNSVPSDLLAITAGDMGQITFNVTDIGNSGDAAIGLRGLSAAGLMATPDLTIWNNQTDGTVNWLTSDPFSNVPISRVLKLTIAAGATPADYPINLTLAGRDTQRWSTTRIFTVRVLMAGVPGDYNGNHVVDAADYTVWRDTLGQSGAGLPADGDRNGTVQPADYTFWKTRFGNTSGSAAILSSTVPEPATLTSLVVGMLAMILWRARPRPGNCT